MGLQDNMAQPQATQITPHAAYMAFQAVMQRDPAGLATAMEQQTPGSGQMLLNRARLMTQDPQGATQAGFREALEAHGGDVNRLYSTLQGLNSTPTQPISGRQYGSAQ